MSLFATVGLIAIAEAKIIDTKINVHFQKICKDVFYLRMADNTRDSVTGEHKGLIWKTPYFTATKTDYHYIVHVDTNKVPSKRIVTYDEVYDGLKQSYNKSVPPNTEELHDEYKHNTLVKGLILNFVIPKLC
jgi:hypothetical protein